MKRKLRFFNEELRMKNEELMMKLTEFLNKVYFLNALNGSLFLNSSLIIHHS